MSILVKSNTKVLVQGITGSFGAKHAQLSIDYGSQVVAGVTPGKGGQVFEHGGKRVPVFDTVAEAVKQTGATASAIFVPAPFAADAVLEGVDARLEVVVCITEGIPARDMIQVKRAMAGNTRTRLVGPNCPGIVTPGEGKDSHGGCRIGIAPGYIHKKGHIGVVSRSGTLTYEAVWQLTSRGVGQSTCVGIGGDPVPGMSHLDVVKLFNEDPDTHAIIMIGEIGGSAEEEAAEWIKKNCRKPVAGFIAGATAPPGRRMGHAGAIVSGGKGTAEAKITAFKDAGIGVAATPSEMADTLLKMM
jgi:succinyl-CoA synthetase alpha subunit